MIYLRWQGDEYNEVFAEVTINMGYKMEFNGS